MTNKTNNNSTINKNIYFKINKINKISTINNNNFFMTKKIKSSLLLEYQSRKNNYFVNTFN